jgi:nucleoside transporter
MPSTLKIRLGLMMFFQYIIWGAWYVTISTYLTQTLHFTGTQAGAVFGTVSIASLVSPFFIGLIADRYFATERIMAVLYLMSAGLIFFMTRATTFGEVYPLMLAFCLCYFPTVSLTNSLAMKNVQDPGKEFPPIRLMGTLSWILVGLAIGYLGAEATTTPFLITAGAAVVMAIFSLTMLPHTPPASQGKAVSLGGALGLDALVMLRKPAFLIFFLASLAACIPITFYYSFANAYLTEVGVQGSAAVQTLGQVAEVGMMLAMPFIFRYVNVRRIVILGLVCWIARYLLLAFGNAGSGMWMFYIAILLHGASYDFFFITGQLYTDQEAPPHLRNTAQGLITFATYGVGMLLGSLLSGGAVDYFTRTVNGVATKDWYSFWVSSAGMAALILVPVAIWFRTKARIEPKAA